MSYIRTKLSPEDKTILQEIYEELEDINIPTTYKSNEKNGAHHAVKTGAVSQKYARQTVFGIIRGKTKSKHTKKYPWILELLKEFMDSHHPDFKFTSVYVNRNVVCKKHLDSKNTGESLLVGLGSYTGGQTTLYIDGKTKKFHIKSQSLIFNGSEISHKSEKFKGIRYSLVFFK
tara:strand:- start:1816 stop:2337 length:522 start_codon:yes stop_codon:yes gene_type:complete